ncbi:DEAD/DEAH box helicase [Thalassotalea sp. Y01]|uniref:DEAD/DEAH box helicase n=1 Tax=Thalassotalea sp. Y01 TaxID=2729613 RepID=UPI00145C3B6C|nr:DEAD/DEAH box helicase [Thalassotalea sp. Y01]NMP16819.1 DEAD/DEAH box helicase [Thalassotalea sp. Y01]
MTDTNNAAVSFDDLGLPEFLLSAIKDMGFSVPTPIQEKTIVPLLQGHDVLGEAQTGTGKTAAFGLPALAKIDTKLRRPQMLVLAPTRELAIQVAEALEDFAKNVKGLRIATLYGGQSYGPQLSQLEKGAQVVVGTPGRLMDHLRRKTLKLADVSFCALDEADEMLNMGFLEDIEWILDHLAKDTQMALFSATMPPAIKKVADRFLDKPVHVKIAHKKESKKNITQLAWKVTGVNKNTALERIIETQDFDAMLIFVRTRNDTITVSELLERQGYPCAALNGDMNQAQRERTVDQLKNGKISVMIATDVVARGLDIPRIDMVINYDLPGDTESYVHRIGRTGRAGREGTALSFVRPREMYNLRHYERATSGQINSFEMPAIEEIGKKRVQRVQKEIMDIAAKQDLSHMMKVLEQMTEQTEFSMEYLAAALLYQKQLKQPLQPKEDPRERRMRDDRRDGRDNRDERRARSDRGERRGDRRPERGNERRTERNDNRPDRGERRRSSGPRVEVDWQAYRIEVGKEHGARPGDIVGAIANEISLDSAYIGQIDLHEQHSIVHLPKGMPKDSYNKLRTVRIRRKQLDITVSDEAVAAAPRRRTNKGERRRAH